MMQSMERLKAEIRVTGDEEERLVMAARGGSARAGEELLARCEPMVRAIASKFRIPGMETGDLRQIARIGVWEAVLDYDPGRGCSFRRFAGVCARSQLLAAAQAERQAYRRALNEAGPIPDEDPTLCAEPAEGPCPAVPAALERARPHLTVLEYAVSVGWCQGRSYAELARALGVSRKCVDNAWKRAKTKMRRLPIWDE
jgi:RNA polymerase sporulation-specific sigma factor